MLYMFAVPGLFCLKQQLMLKQVLCQPIIRLS